MRGMAKTIRAPRGLDLTTRGWQQEGALRMLMNNLDPEVAEHPEQLVVYGGSGKAARSWEAYDAIVRTLQTLDADETLLVQSGKPVGVFRTHEWAPRVLIANSNLVGDWANWEHFRELEAKGLMMYGQMTAGSWIYIGSQGIVQGTYETFVEPALQHQFGGDGINGVVAVAAALAALGPALALGLEGGQAFIMGKNRQIEAAIQTIGKFLRPGAEVARGAVHVQGHADHHCVGLPLLDQLFDFFPLGDAILGFQVAQFAGLASNHLAHSHADGAGAVVEAQQ